MKQNETVQGILNAIELYAEAGRKASRELGEKAFTKEATMSWVEKGVITTVPINALFDVLEQTGEEEVAYTVEDMTVAGNPRSSCGIRATGFTSHPCFLYFSLTISYDLRTSSFSASSFMSIFGCTLIQYRLSPLKGSLTA